jgi:hypothetical protein
MTLTTEIIIIEKPGSMIDRGSLVGDNVADDEHRQTRVGRPPGGKGLQTTFPCIYDRPLIRFQLCPAKGNPSIGFERNRRKRTF